MSKNSGNKKAFENFSEIIRKFRQHFHKKYANKSD